MSDAPILVVDDDPKIVTLVRTYLEREGSRRRKPGGHRRGVNLLVPALSPGTGIAARAAREFRRLFHAWQAEGQPIPRLTWRGETDNLMG